MGCLWTALLFVGQAAGQNPVAKPEDKSQLAYLAEFKKLKAETDKLQRSFSKEYAAAKEDEARRADLSDRLAAKSLPLAERALALVRPHAVDKEAVQVFAW